MSENRGPFLINVLTVALLLATCASTAAIALIFYQPTTSLNPFPPPTQLSVAVLPTQSNLPTAEVAIVTVTLPPELAASSTPTTAPPTLTPTSTASPTRTPPPPSLTPTLTPPPTSQPQSGGTSFRVQEGTPVALANFANDQGCNWLGVAGIVLDSQGNGLDDYVVRLQGGGTSRDVFSGSAPAYSSTGGGFEFTLDDHVVATEGVYSLGVYNSNGTLVSQQIFFDTYADCDRNLILINFEAQ